MADGAEAVFGCGLTEFVDKRLSGELGPLVENPNALRKSYLDYAMGLAVLGEGVGDGTHATRAAVRVQDPEREG